jgi:hypothetical protein
MGYSNFKKLSQVTEKFSVKTKLVTLFGTIVPVSASAWLVETLDLAYLAPLMNEKAKSERIVSPILIEVLKKYPQEISFFSGENLEINPQQDLSGACDFFFALSPPSMVLEAPIVSIVEAKDEDLEWGIAQCAAQMLGAKIFNENEGKPINVIYGCATDGIEWQFLRLENDCFYIDKRPMTDLPQILGTWHHIIQFFLDNYGVH